MKVYIITREPYHDNSTILGAFATLEGAMASNPVEWKTDGFYVKSCPGVVAEAKASEYEDLFIYELPLCP